MTEETLARGYRYGLGHQLDGCSGCAEPDYPRPDGESDGQG